jgi:hypothetical protein
MRKDQVVNRAASLAVPPTAVDRQLTSGTDQG